MDNLKQILFVRPGAIGDVILTLPLIRMLRKQFPPAKITLCISKRMHGLLRGEADVVLDMDSVEVLTLLSHDSVANYDMTIYFSKEKPVFAGDIPSFYCIDPRPADTGGMHITEYYLSRIPHLKDGGIPDSYISINQEKQNEAIRILADSNLKQDDFIVTIHPGSGNPKKNLPPEKFALFVDILKSARDDIKIVLIEGEADEIPLKQLREYLKENPPVISSIPLDILAEILRLSSLHIGNDSGITHLSAAIGTRTIAVFLSTDPSIWSPAGKSASILTPDSLVDDFKHIASSLFRPV